MNNLQMSEHVMQTGNDPPCHQQERENNCRQYNKKVVFKKHEKLKSKENNLQISLHEMLAKDTP